MNKIFAVSMILVIQLLGSDLKVIDSGISQIAESITKQMKQNNLKRLAIGDFTSNGTKTMFERYLENEITNSIVARGIQAPAVIERRRLSEVLSEQKLGATGLLEKSTRAKLGKILGVDAIVSGETIVTSKEAKVSVRLYAVNTGSILAAPSFVFDRNQAIDELMAEPALSQEHSNLLQKSTTNSRFHNRILQKISYLVVTILDIKRVDNEVRITLKISSTNRKYGASVAIYARGSDNIADFWKFRPVPKMAELSDENGNNYNFRNTTMKSAKTNKDWTTIPVNGSEIVRFTFAKSGDFKMGDKFTFSVLIYTVLMDKNNRASKSSSTIYLDGLIAH